MGLSLSIFNDNSFNCYDKSGSENFVSMQRICGISKITNFESPNVIKIDEMINNKDKEDVIYNNSVFCINQSHNKTIPRPQSLRKKVSKFKKKGNPSSSDYSNMFYEFISGWSHRELQALKHEYEALRILKELDKQTNKSRPQVSSLIHDLNGLFKTEIFADTEICFKGKIFKVHRALLSVRSVFFRQCFNSWKVQPDITLSNYNSNSSMSCGSCHYKNNNKSLKPIPIYLDNPSVTPDVFKRILQYIYTEHLDIDDNLMDNWDIIYLLREKFHLPNRLQFDMKRLFEDTSKTDCVLVFSQSSDFLSLDFSPFSIESVSKDAQLLDFIRHFHFNITNNAISPNPDETGIEYDNNFLYNVSYELPCHRSILAARSNLFKRIIEIKLNDNNIHESNKIINSQHFNSETTFEYIISAPMRITIEESIISHRYARVVLYCLYTGQLNMQLIVTKHYSDRRSSTLDLTATLNMESCSQINRFNALSQHPSAAGLYIHTFIPSCINCLKDVMQLYQIGSYIEFNLLCHNCEDLLIKNISLDNFIDLLRWSSQPFGSAFVRRYVISWMREAFMDIINSQYLQELLKGELIEIISSQFTEVPEVEILNGIIKWGESQLILPIVPMDCHKDSNIVIMLKDLYLKRSQIKNKHINDPALSKIINNLLPYVNFNQFFPGSENVKASLIRRGVIQGMPNAADFSDPCNPIQSKQLWCRMINSREMKTEIFQSPHYLDTQYNIQSLDLPKPHFNFNKQYASFRGPRLVSIFYDQLKIVISERLKNTKPLKFNDETSEIKRIRPLDRKQSILMADLPLQFPLLSLQQKFSSETNKDSNKSLKRSTYLNVKITNAIHKRVKDLQSEQIVQRALFMPCVSWLPVFHLLRLQSLREYGIPDQFLTQVFNEKLIGKSYDTLSANTPVIDIPQKIIRPVTIARSYSHLIDKSDYYDFQTLRMKYRSKSLKSKKNIDINKRMSYYESNNTISDGRNPDFERVTIRNCRCRQNKMAICYRKNYDTNFMTILSRTDININKTMSMRRSRNPYLSSSSVLVLPSTLQFKNDIDHNSYKHKAKHKTFDKCQDVQGLSRAHSFRTYKDNTVRSKCMEHNTFIQVSGSLDNHNDTTVNNAKNSYNPWVFNRFNFKTNKSDLFDNDNIPQPNTIDSARIFLNESPKTDFPLYGLEERYRHSMCLACHNLTQSSLQLNYMSRSDKEAATCLKSSNKNSKEVEL